MRISLKMPSYCSPASQSIKQLIKLRSTIDLRRTYINNALKVIMNYLQPYAKKENTITNALKFPKVWKSSGADDSYEDIPYNAQLLFTSIPVNETIN